MLKSILVAYLAAASTPLAAATEFYWMYKPDNGTESYDPIYEVCARNNATSCADCNSSESDSVGGKSCKSDLYNNICYEPKQEETCCQDAYGTSCYKDFYCAYTDQNIAFCCAEDESTEDCGKHFNETLSKDHPKNEDKDNNRSQTQTTTLAVATTTVHSISAFQPSMTATDQSRVARPERTTPPNLIPGSTKTSTKDPEVQEKMSAAVKIGIAIAVFAGSAILITIAVLAFLHWRKKTRYNTLGAGHAGDKLSAMHPEPYQVHVTPPPVSGGHGPFEPMRSELPTAPAPYAGAGAGAGADPFSDHHAAYTDFPMHPLGQNPPNSHH